MHQLATIESPIEAVTIEESARPFWSVMIPTYNRPDYLKETLLSVLSQDPGPDEMQIEVVDNCSTSEEIENIVREIGKGRVLFYRQDITVNYIDNWNTCIKRAVGHWVHILHDDDVVNEGFFSSYRKVIEFEPNIGMITCRCNMVNEQGALIAPTNLLQEESGIIQDVFEKLFVFNTIYAPSVVVKRNVYETIGGFSHKCLAVSDWDMWKRISVTYPIWYEAGILFSYRIHHQSGTSNVLKSGHLHKSTRRSIEVSKYYCSYYDYSSIEGRSNKLFYEDAVNVAYNFIYKKEYKSAANLFIEAIKFNVGIKIKIKESCKFLLVMLKEIVVNAMPKNIKILLKRFIYKFKH